MNVFQILSFLKVMALPPAISFEVLGDFSPDEGVLLFSSSLLLLLLLLLLQLISLFFFFTFFTFSFSFRVFSTSLPLLEPGKPGTPGSSSCTSFLLLFLQVNLNNFDHHLKIYFLNLVIHHFYLVIIPSTLKITNFLFLPHCS